MAAWRGPSSTAIVGVSVARLPLSRPSVKTRKTSFPPKSTECRKPRCRRTTPVIERMVPSGTSAAWRQGGRPTASLVEWKIRRPRLDAIPRHRPTPRQVPSGPPVDRAAFRSVVADEIPHGESPRRHHPISLFPSQFGRHTRTRIATRTRCDPARGVIESPTSQFLIFLPSATERVVSPSEQDAI